MKSAEKKNNSKSVRPEPVEGSYERVYFNTVRTEQVSVANASKYLERIKQDLKSVLQKEANSILNLIKNLPNESVDLIKLILKTSGKVIFSGLGKSGLVAQKLAATFSSMGIPSIFLHPSEALHGDLGIVQKNDFIIALSKSGTGEELRLILQTLKNKNKTTLICCNEGYLSSLSDLTIKLPFENEACNLGLAPTSSSTLMVAFGDSLAVVLSKLIGFEKQDFARNHPAGALGKQLLSTVKNFMYTDLSLPFVSKEDSFKDLLSITTEKKLGSAIVVDEDKKLLGIVTDGDLRRSCDKFGPELFSKKVEDVMTKSVKTIDENSKAYDALKIMEKFNITSLIVKKDAKVVGMIHLHDLVKAGIK